MTTLARKTYAVMITGALLWCLLLVAAPAAAALDWHTTANALYAFFDRICHQMEGRSLHLAGEPLAVCARCTGIYAAFTLGLLLVPLVRRLDDTTLPQRWILFLGLAPMALDAVTSILDFHEATTLTRLITGSIAGLILAQFIVPAAVGGIAELFGATAPSPSSHHLEGRADA
jgi:uncharacterized membrane protein